MALLGTIVALMLWPATDPDIVEHHQDDLPADHPHLREGHGDGRASHAYVIDEIHPCWPG
ncbi:hypothetical protein L6Q21_02895 [Sandaracinobacter sp. RS1-74]|uniref:hypothetical protein n=1 Tax=Sandaracinobacteroides sayramensis TaxID=2913411 RepID=UPI000DB0118E|nr:hypothetical protein [Sandaracinobacteroides sayramensis]MCG2839929.1 hypothetical protein [Sandaracinobacteroides sayramensis]PZU43949.1 MAG: hypothetical protein DI568_16595 [Sphingomonas sp.]